MRTYASMSRPEWSFRVTSMEKIRYDHGEAIMGADSSQVTLKVAEIRRRLWKKVEGG